MGEIVTVAGGVLVVPTILMAIGGMQLRRTHRLRVKGVRVPGEVVHVYPSHGSEGSHVLMRFRTQDGSDRSVGFSAFGMGSLRPGHRPVTVVYDPTDPNRARPEQALRSGCVWGTAFFLLGASVAIPTIVVIVMLLFR